MKYVIDRLSCYSIAYYISSSYGDGLMAILALKGVARAMRKLHCSDEMMAAACAEIAAGLTDADLGSN